MIKGAVELWLECADEAEVARRLADPKIAVKPLAVAHAQAAGFSGAELCALLEKEGFHKVR